MSRTEILTALSAGELSLRQATAQLGLPDAGWTLQLLRDSGKWLYQLDDAASDRLAEEGYTSLMDCLRPEVRAALESVKS